MLIDWFTVGAQVLNFVVLVWLMKRLLYKPIQSAIAAREKAIAGKLADADAQQAEAQQERDQFQQKSDAFDQQRAVLLAQATEEVKSEGQRLLAEARQAADALSAKRRETLTREAGDLHEAIRRRTQQEVFAIARKALADLATTGLEERLAAVFTRRLRELSGPPKSCLAEALRTATEPALVRSAFDLPAEQRAVVQNALNETFAADLALRFETAPELIGGIELTAGGQKVAWSIAEYLAAMEKSLAELLKEKDAPAPKAEPTPAPKAEPDADAA